MQISGDQNTVCRNLLSPACKSTLYLLQPIVHINDSQRHHCGAPLHWSFLVLSLIHDISYHLVTPVFADTNAMINSGNDRSYGSEISLHSQRKT